MTFSRSCRRSHCDANRVASASARGAASMPLRLLRQRARQRQAGPARPLQQLRVGPAPHRKNDSRDASS